MNMLSFKKKEERWFQKPGWGQVNTATKDPDGTALGAVSSLSLNETGHCPGLRDASGPGKQDRYPVGPGEETKMPNRMSFMLTSNGICLLVLDLLRAHHPFLFSNFYFLELEYLFYAFPTIVFSKHLIVWFHKFTAGLEFSLKMHHILMSQPYLIEMTFRYNIGLRVDLKLS